jgi:hypothetical protein
MSLPQSLRYCFPPRRRLRQSAAAKPARARSATIAALTRAAFAPTATVAVGAPTAPPATTVCATTGAGPPRALTLRSAMRRAASAPT